jgi:general secretion pathway protein B
VVYEGEPQPGDRPAPEPGNVVYEGAATPDAEPRPSEAPGRSEAPAPDAGRSLPTYQDLQLRGELSLAPMHIDIHVYSDNEAERFVFINMRKYIQGDKTTEGPIVESINADGVTLSHQGRRFSLPRD